MPTASIQYVEDKNGDVFFPVAHTSGVVDDEGVSVASSLSTINSSISNLESTGLQSVVYSNTEYAEI